MPKLRLIQPHVIIPRYRMLRMPVIAAEFSPYIDVEVNDENIEKLDTSPVDVVGITCQSYNANRAFYISDIFRRKGIKTILGGVFATAMPQLALEHFDSVVIGEVEGLGKEIVDDLKKGTLKKTYKNETPPDLTNTNMPRIDLLKNNKYYHLSFPIETSRGCPHRCSFCFCKYQYPTHRLRSLKDIDRDLKQYDFGVVELLDHHCTANKKHLFDVCDVFKSNNVFSWMGEATIMSLKDEEVVKRISDAGCRMIFVGLETVSSAALSGVNKSFNDLEEYKRIIRMCQDYGVYIFAGLMWGLNGQDKTVYDETYKFLVDTRTYIAGSNLLVYYPGTEIYNEQKAQGRILSYDLRDYDCEHITVLPDNFDAKILLKGIRKFHRKFYSIGSIFKRSFQATNRNLTLLYDYLGFNWSYRVYMQKWVKRVSRNLKELIKHQKQGITPPVHENPTTLTEKTSRPWNYKSVPLTYAILSGNWKYWEFWIMMFIRPKGRPRFFFTSFSFAAYLTAAAVLFEKLRVPLTLSPILSAILLYVVLWNTSELAVFTAAKWIRNRILANITVLALSAPLFYLPFTLDNLIIRIIFACWNTFFFLKNISFIASSERKTSGFYRYHAFMVLHPTINFTDAYKMDLLRSTFGKAAKLYFIGLFQIAVAAAALVGIFVIYVNFYQAFDPFTREFFYTIPLKAIYLYCAFAGFMNIGVSMWVVWGYKVPPTFTSPLLATSTRNFWKRFDTEHYRFSLNAVYTPIIRACRKYPKLILPFATFIPFLVSAVIYLYIFASVLPLDASSLIYAKYILAFFGIHYLLTTIQALLTPRKKRRIHFIFRFFSAGLTLAFVVASSMLFFIVTDKVIMTIIEH